MHHRAVRLVFVISALSAAPSLAHIELDFPAPRWTDQKAGPCGKVDGGRTQTHTAFQPGATITVEWTETIDHPGHFRVSFDPDGEDDFVDPASFEELNSAPSVLVDGIEDKGGGAYAVDVTLPDVACEGCTLQLIQVMTDKAPYGDGNDLYYQCADLVLRSDAPEGGERVGDEPSDEPNDEPGGCAQANVAGAPFSVAAAALLIAGLLRRRRRR